MVSDPEALRKIHARMQVAASHLRLPFRAHAWRGQSGEWMGTGSGSSIDYQDHRPYMPGDDPRYIDWQAYARSGHYTMKLYREEVSPSVDLVLDVSESMFFEPEKAARSMELFYFCLESTLQSRASLRCHLVKGHESAYLPLASAQAHQFAPVVFRKTDFALPWRQGSLRVFISDLLFPGSPEAHLLHLASGKGRGIMFTPFARSESDPDWSGNAELTDCETGRRRVQNIPPELLANYRETYRRHFSIWKDAARKHRIAVARVPSEPALLEALQAEALLAGAVEFV